MNKYSAFFSCLVRISSSLLLALPLPQYARLCFLVFNSVSSASYCPLWIIRESSFSLRLTFACHPLCLSFLYSKTRPISIALSRILFSRCDVTCQESAPQDLPTAVTNWTLSLTQDQNSHKISQVISETLNSFDSLSTSWF